MIKSILKSLGLLKPVEIGDTEPVSTVVAAPGASVRPCSSHFTSPLHPEASQRSKLEPNLFPVTIHFDSFASANCHLPLKRRVINDVSPPSAHFYRHLAKYCFNLLSFTFWDSSPLLLERTSYKLPRTTIHISFPAKSSRSFPADF